MNAKCLEKETRTIHRKIIEGIFIKILENKVINISEGLTLSNCYVKGEDCWIKNRREGRG